MNALPMSSALRRTVCPQSLVAKLLRSALAVALSVPLSAFAQTALAQSPAPTYYMDDSRPGNSFPPNAPYTSGPAGAVVVEGLGSINCSGSYYSQSQIESAAVQWINASYNTVIEISPQTACGTLSQYESLVNGITTYVEGHASYPGQYWGGFMLDEEPGFGFSASDLESLNIYTQGVMKTTPGMSWYFTEDQPNGWGLSTYNAILESSWPAPMAYTTSMVNAINAACSTYSVCTNLVTVDTNFSYPWNDYQYVTPLVNGTPWQTSYWAAAYYWWNAYRNQ
ncbi:MAG TPA: hypothetical protein VF802_05330 [Candidatus Limnocylindrales bacterium]